MSRLTVVIVSYRVKDYATQCLFSLRRALEGIDAEVYVVDNNSQDGTVEQLSSLFPEVKVIASNHNLGFSRANNVAIRRAAGEYVLLLNPDTIVGEDTVRNCLAFMDSHPKAGGLGVRMLKSDGSDAMESRRGIPTPTVAFYKMSGLCKRFPQSRRFGKYYMGYLPWNEASQIEVISGAYCMLRREAIEKIGLLDEDFFMYGEDIDLSYRLIKGGYENWYVPEKILHYKGESTQKSSFRYVHVFYDAMLIFFRKHYGHVSVFISIPIKIAIYAKALSALAYMQIGRLKSSLGMARRKKLQNPLYVFFVSRSSYETCKQLVAQKGIEAQYIIADEMSNKDGHRRLSLPAGRQVYAVYDVEAFSFNAIFDMFSSNPDSRVTIGTYFPDRNVVITTEEVLK